jgi:hypothetical protein
MCLVRVDELLNELVSTVVIELFFCLFIICFWWQWYQAIDLVLKFSYLLVINLEHPF